MSALCLLATLVACLAGSANAFVACPLQGCLRNAAGAAQCVAWPGSRSYDCRARASQARMCAGQDDPKGGQEGSDDKSIAALLALPTGEMLIEVRKMLCKPRVSLPTFLASTLLNSVILSAVLLFAFFSNTDIGFLDLSSQDASSKSVLLFAEVLKDLESGYVEKVDTDKLFQTAMEAMTASLDPYTEFETKTVSEDNLIRFNGRYAGVGMGIERDWKVDAQKGKTIDRNRFRVSSAIQGYAWDAGMRPGDHLIAIDSRSLAGSNLRDVTNMLRGEAGSKVTVTFERDGLEGAVAAVMTRKEIKLRDVPVATFVGAPQQGVAYVQVRSFAMDTKQEVVNAIDKLASSTGNEVKALMLDLRANPGGLLSSAVGVAEIFVPQGTTIVETRGRDDGGAGAFESRLSEGTGLKPSPLQGKEQEAKATETQKTEPTGAEWRYTSSRPPLLDPDMRLVVLTDGGSASASEIVAGAIQDLDRGLIVGGKTFGKGLVQQVVSLPFDTSLKLTIARYYTPSGRCIQAIDYGQQQQQQQTAQLDGAAPSRVPQLLPPADDLEDEPGDDEQLLQPVRARKVQESQRRAYTTLRKGRVVRDGGGIEPDVLVRTRDGEGGGGGGAGAGESVPEIEIQLSEQDIYEKFVNEWQRRHPLAFLPATTTPGNPSVVTPAAKARAAEMAVKNYAVVDDKMYDEFAKFVQDRDRSGFQARTRFDKYLKQLSDAMLQEGMEELSSQTAALTKTAEKDLIGQLKENREKIKQVLEDALLNRQLPEALRLSTRLQYDKTVEVARALLLAPEEYSALLKEGVVVNGSPPPPATQLPSK